MRWMSLARYFNSSLAGLRRETKNSDCGRVLGASDREHRLDRHFILPANEIRNGFGYTIIVLLLWSTEIYICTDYLLVKVQSPPLIHEIFIWPRDVLDLYLRFLVDSKLTKNYCCNFVLIYTCKINEVVQFFFKFKLALCIEHNASGIFHSERWLTNFKAYIKLTTT